MKTMTIFAIALIGFPIAAFATLGESSPSITTDKQMLQATEPVTEQLLSVANMPYHVSTMITPEGITVKEFQTQDGSVFAIKWQGSTFPNQNQLLGKYFKSYSIQSNQVSSLRMKVVNSNGLYVATGGLPGKFSGIAVLTDKLPTGVTIKNLK